MALCSRCNTEYSVVFDENCPKCKNRDLGDKVIDVANEVVDLFKF